MTTSQLKMMAAGAVLLFLVGCVIQVLGVIWFEQVDAWYADWGVGAVITVAGAMMAIYSFPQLLGKDYAMEAPEPLSSEAYVAALTEATLPVWTCNRCKVVEPGDGLGSCVYCDSSMEFLQVDDEAVRQTALTAAS